MGVKPKLNSELPSSWHRIIMIMGDVYFEILVFFSAGFPNKVIFFASKKIKSKKIWEVQGVMEVSNCRRGSKPDWQNASTFLVLTWEGRGHGGLV